MIQVIMISHVDIKKMSDNERINQFQELMCELILKVCCSQAMFTYGEKQYKTYNYLLSQLLRQYSEVNSEGIGVHHDIDLCKKSYQFTVRAVNALDEFEKKYAKLSNSKKRSILWKDFLHPEHIMPNVIIRNKLQEKAKLNGFTLSVVKAIMHDCKIIILSKEESRVLDGSKLTKYMLDGVKVNGFSMRTSGVPEERLSAIGASIHSEYMSNKL